MELDALGRREGAVFVRERDRAPIESWVEKDVYGLGDAGSCGIGLSRAIPFPVPAILASFSRSNVCARKRPPEVAGLSPSVKVALLLKSLDDVAL